MQIETYEIEETDQETPEVEAEAVKLIEQLGLEGQKSFITRPADEAGKRRFPYPEMTAKEMKVYQAVFPTRSDVKKYSHGIIPVRVLQVAAHALEFCDVVQVWHKEIADPDPLLIGYIGQNDYSVKKMFLLARWGDALKPFDRLVEEARIAIRERIEISCKDQISEAQGRLSNLDSLVEKTLNGTVYTGF